MLQLILKLSGALMIIFSSVAASRMFIVRLKNRVKLTEGMISGFISAEEHICAMLRPFEEAFLYAAEDAGPAKKLFISVAAASGDIRERFMAVSEDNKDAKAVIQFVSGICACDEAERRTAFSLIRSRLEQQYTQLADEFRRLRRLYNAAGVFCGLVLVILLL